MVNDDTVMFVFLLVGCGSAMVYGEKGRKWIRKLNVMKIKGNMLSSVAGNVGRRGMGVMGVAGVGCTTIMARATRWV